MGIFDALFGNGMPSQGILSPSVQQQPGGSIAAGLSNFSDPRLGLLGRLSNSIQGFTTGQRTDPVGMQLQQQQSTYEALKQSGLPDAVARAAALSPEVLKTVAPNIYTKPTFGVIGQNQLGVNQYGFIHPNSETVKPAEVGGQGVQSQGGIDPNLTGDEFLKAVAADKTLGPGKANMVKAIAEGRQPYPSGFLLKTPFGQWLTSAVGQYEPGLDATLIGRRKVFNDQLGSTSPTSAGGQKSLMGTSLGHLSEVADAAESLANSAGPIPSLPGGAYLAHGINAFNNSSVTQSAKVKALDDAVQKFAGEVGKLYSGSAGGGIGEREATRSRFSGNLSPQEMAASLEMSKALIQSKLAALENQRDQIFGPNAKNQIDFLGDNGRKAIAKIDAAIAKLGGTIAPAAPNSLPPGWSVKAR